MIRQLRARPGGDAVGVVIADLAGFDLPRTDYGAAVCAVSTLFMLPHAGQRTEHSHSQAGTHTVHSRHDPDARTISITRGLGEQDGATSRTG